MLLLHIAQFTNAPLQLPHAYLAVDFFFLLSGFVVANAYENKLLHSMTFRTFVKIRLVRLYPGIFIGGLIGAFVLLIRVVTTHSLTYSGWLFESIGGLVLFPTSIMSQPDPSNDNLFPINPPSWSLFFELMINFVYAIMVPALSTRRLWTITIASAIALVGAAAWHGNISVGCDSVSFFWGFIRVTCPFFIGVLLRRYRPSHHPGNVAGVALLMGLAALLLNSFQTEERIYGVLAIIFVFPTVVFIGTACSSDDVTRKACSWLGELSYPLYVIHHPMIRMIVNGLAILHWHLSLWITAGLCTVAAITAAVMLLLLWDRPVRKYLMTAAGA